MTRLIAAAGLFGLLALPALACQYDQVSTGAGSAQAAATQPAPAQSNAPWSPSQTSTGKAPS